MNHMDKVAADGCHLINKKGGSGWSRLFCRALYEFLIKRLKAFY